MISSSHHGWPWLDHWKLWWRLGTHILGTPHFKDHQQNKWQFNSMVDSLAWFTGKSSPKTGTPWLIVNAKNKHMGFRFRFSQPNQSDDHDICVMYTITIAIDFHGKNHGLLMVYSTLKGWFYHETTAAQRDSDAKRCRSQIPKSMSWGVGSINECMVYMGNWENLGKTIGKWRFP